MKKQARITLSKTVTVALTLVLLVIILLPFFVMISTMLKPVAETYVTPPYWIPKEVRLKNFVDIFVNRPFGAYFQTSIVVSVFTTLLTAALSVPAAYAVARFRFKGKKTIFYIYLVIQMFAPVIVIIPIFRIVAFLHLRNTYLALILADSVFALSFTTWMLASYFRTIPASIEESALVDGCSRLRTIPTIMIPIAAPGVVTAVIYSFIVAWNDFIFGLTLTDSVNRTPITLGIVTYAGRFYSQWPYLMGAAFLAIIPVIVLFLLIERQLVQGITSGAVKE